MKTENKQFDQLTSEDLKDLKIEFAPGCFDTFEGTQEELDELTAEIKRMFLSGEAQQMSVPVDFDNLDEHDLARLSALSENKPAKRTLQ